MLKPYSDFVEESNTAYSEMITEEMEAMSKDLGKLSGPLNSENLAKIMSALSAVTLSLSNKNLRLYHDWLTKQLSDGQ